MNNRESVEYTHSDHQAIRYHFSGTTQAESSVTQLNRLRWKTLNFNKEVLGEALRLENSSLKISADQFIVTLYRACESTIPKKGNARSSRRYVHWWNPTIANLGSQRARRKMQSTSNDYGREQRMWALLGSLPRSLGIVQHSYSYSHSMKKE